MTNREFINSLTDKEWVLFVGEMNDMKCSVCAFNKKDKCSGNYLECQKGFLLWLKQEREELKIKCPKCKFSKWVYRATNVKDLYACPSCKHFFWKDGKPFEFNIANGESITIKMEEEK